MGVPESNTRVVCETLRRVHWGEKALNQLYLQRAPLRSEVGGKHLSSGKWARGVMGVRMLPGAVVPARSP